MVLVLDKQHYLMPFLQGYHWLSSSKCSGQGQGCDSTGLPAIHTALVNSQHHVKLGKVAHNCNASTWEVEVAEACHVCLPSKTLLLRSRTQSTVSETDTATSATSDNWRSTYRTHTAEAENWLHRLASHLHECTTACMHTKKLFVIDTFWERGNGFSPVNVSGYINNTPRQDPCLRVAKTKRTFFF